MGFVDPKCGWGNGDPIFVPLDLETLSHAGEIFLIGFRHFPLSCLQVHDLKPLQGGEGQAPGCAQAGVTDCGFVPVDDILLLLGLLQSFFDLGLGVLVDLTAGLAQVAQAEPKVLLVGVLLNLPKAHPVGLSTDLSAQVFLHLLAPLGPPLLPQPIQRQRLHQGGLLPLVKLVFDLFLQLIAHLPILALMEAVHPGCKSALDCHTWHHCSPQIQRLGPDDVSVVDGAGVGQDGGGGEARQSLALGPQQEDVAGQQLGQQSEVPCHPHVLGSCGGSKDEGEVGG
ncbi:hypothetical protein HGM15179_006774 [Zosterops borbonicus]|uniref:Uncharacterized protein n=1 Tax=Zosterops borbonicus TaxID=364589 RepID=A0A8K1GM70_9PASS|nr:hypothetical protein HGM15179_006774 [Zosterops borbonicus]